MNLSCCLDENVQKISQDIGCFISCDAKYRTYTLLNQKVYLFFVSSLVSEEMIQNITKRLLEVENISFDVLATMYNNITHADVKKEKNIEQIEAAILSGMIAFLIEGINEAILVETRHFPTRSISEPDMEKTIRGSHDGFTESIEQNLGLIRRRIKDKKLRNIMYSIGEDSSFSVCLSYIEGICSEAMLKEIKDKLNKVQVSHLIMADKALEEVLLEQKWNPYPLVRYTERPDIVSIHLYQGDFCLLVDTSPSVILAPATYFDHLTHTEEYRQTPMSGSYLRILRYIGVFCSIFLTPLWYMFHVKDVFSFFSFPLLWKDSTAILIFLQLIFAEIGVEFLRMASIHTPSTLSTAMGLVAGILIGNVAIDVGLLSEEAVFIVAVSAIGSYMTPSYELGLANKITKLILLWSIFFFYFYGFLVATILWIIYLAHLKSFTKPYLYPLIPFRAKELIHVLFRLPKKEVKENAKIKM